MSISRSVMAEVESRAGGACEACTLPLLGRSGGPDDDAVHHRVGGSGRRRFESAPDLLLLHGRCHRWVHAHPYVSREHGFIVARGLVDQGLTPAEVPVVPNRELAAVAR